MSILIPGKMPPSCEGCPCAYYTEGVHHDYCQAVGYDSKLPDEGRPDWCPIIELPPHGRLIDADKIETERHGNNSQRTMWRNIRQLLSEAETIIPAEEE